MGLFNIPSPVDLIETIKDEGEKRAALSLVISIIYSQYITFLYEFGTGLKGRKFVGWLSEVFIRMAASAFKMLQLQNSTKLIYLSTPAALIEDTKLLDLIWWEKEQHK